jgi:hypothetical protein
VTLRVLICSVQEFDLAKDLTSKVVRQKADRIARVEGQLRETEKLLAASAARDDSHAARRLYATIFGLPLGIAAFLYLGIYWSSSNNTGVYVGIVCAFILWLIARHILGLPESETHLIVKRIKQLEQERIRQQESLKKHIGDSDPPPPIAAVKDDAEVR